MLPRLLHVGSLEVVHRKLQLILQADLAVLYRPSIRANDPRDVIDRIYILEKRSDSLQSIGQLSRDWIEIDTAALLEVRELRNLQPVEHYLPADAPRAQRRRLPIVFFELYVVLTQIDSDRFQRLQVQLLHIRRRWLQNDLELHVLEQPVRVLAITAIRRSPRRLHVSHVIGLRSQHAQEGLR